MTYGEFDLAGYLTAEDDALHRKLLDWTQTFAQLKEDPGENIAEEISCLKHMENINGQISLLNRINTQLFSATANGIRVKV